MHEGTAEYSQVGGSFRFFVNSARSPAPLVKELGFGMTATSLYEKQW